MNTDNWKPFFKLDHSGYECMSQQTYEPLLNLEKNVFCANYEWTNKYQRREDPIRPLYTEESVNYFFDQEVKYILKYNNSYFMPKILDIDYQGKKIFYEWHGDSCNHLIYGSRNLDTVCPDWKEQIKNILLDLYKSGTYKLTMYPHCHYVARDGQIKSIDWYGCIPVDDPWVNSAWMDSIIHHTAKFRLEETGAIIDGKYNLEKMFQNSMHDHVLWGRQDLKYIYEHIFNKE
jgi:hypothetical protein